MPIFRYTAYTVSGEIREGSLEASSTTEALDLLHKRGLLPSSAKEVDASNRTNQFWGFSSLFGSLNGSDFADLTRELATLVQAELPLDESLRLMATQAGSAKLRALTSKLLDCVISGAALSEGFLRHAPDAPPVIASLLRAGESRGNLGATLSDLALFLEMRAETRSKVSAALTYPIILTLTAMVAMAIIMSVLVPALLPLFEDTGAPIPMALAIGNKLALLIADYWPIMTLGLVALSVITWWIFQTEKVLLAKDRLALWLPLIGSLIQKNSIFMFARTLGTLLKNGVPLIQALEDSAAVIPNRAIAKAVAEAIAPVQEGERLAKVLAQSKVVPSTALRFVAIGEESSRLDAMLLHMAALYEKDTSRQLDRIMTLFTPAITVIIGIAVGGLILSVMQAVLSVNDLALQ